MPKVGPLMKRSAMRDSEEEIIDVGDPESRSEDDHMVPETSSSPAIHSSPLFLSPHNHLEAYSARLHSEADYER